MPSPDIATVVKMMEMFPEPTQHQVVAHLHEYLLDLQDESKWDASFAKTQTKLVDAARRAKEQIAEGKAELWRQLP